ncbi:MAG: dihydrolipoyl dehydrogenase [Gemmatimonadetes bacterium]|nr:dihydrolipoyl dehydrogenase [Gemmatimonadota bacterium]
MKFDVVIIGGGSAGYAAARTASDLGADVAVIDKGPLGGLCILRGCMPSKTLLRSSDIMSLMKRAEEFGLSTGRLGANMARINDRKKKLIKEFSDYRAGQLKDPKYNLIQGKAEFLDAHRVKVGKKTIESKAFIVTTGSDHAQIPVPGLAESGYLTSDELLDSRELYKSMIVLGGGPVATELGQFYCRLGTKTTLIQRSGHILSASDEDLARPVEAKLREDGMEVYTDTHLTNIERTKTGVKVSFTHDGIEKTASAAVIFNALGRTPAIAGLNLEAAGVEVEGRRIKVDDAMRSNVPHIFAAGDVVGMHEIVHIAIQQGEAAGQNAVAGQEEQRVDYRLRAEVTFTDPQVATVGACEKECQLSRRPYLVETYPFDDHGKSMVMGELHGFVKLLCDPDSGEIIGGQAVGPEASELIHEIIAVMYFRGTVFDVAQMPHYHPTLSEIWTYPAEDLADQFKGEKRSEG